MVNITGYSDVKELLTCKIENRTLRCGADYVTHDHDQACDRGRLGSKYVGTRETMFDNVCRFGPFRNRNRNECASLGQASLPLTLRL